MVDPQKKDTAAAAAAAAVSLLVIVESFVAGLPIVVVFRIAWSSWPKFLLPRRILSMFLDDNFANALVRSVEVADVFGIMPLHEPVPIDAFE